MKKILMSLLAASIMLTVACGPSAEEKAAMEKAKQDSTEAANKAVADSIAAVQNAAMEKEKADAAAAQAMEKARQDSMEAAAKKKAPAKKK